MVHRGRHILIPGTDLCEICDRGEIYMRKRGLRKPKQYLYTTQDGKFSYRAQNDTNHGREQVPPPVTTAAPRHTRKPLYVEPLPTRSRPVMREEPVGTPKLSARRAYTPPDDYQRTPRAYPATLYYMDDATPRTHTTRFSDEPARRYTTHPQEVSPRPARVVQQQRAHTPPRRQMNGDPYFHDASRKPNLYHLDEPRSVTYYAPVTSTTRRPRDDYVPPPKVVHHDETPRRQRQLDPIEAREYDEPEMTVVRRVYKKLPPGRYDPPEDDHVSNGHRPARKVDTSYPPARQYDSSPQFNNRRTGSPIPNKHPAIYYIQSTNAY